MRKNLLRLRQAPFNYWLGRSGWVVIAGFGSIVILLLILNIATTEAKEGLLKGIYILLYEKNTAGAWTVVLAIVSSPIAFVLWYFRDKNQQLQIENHRKDINLKDFQKLCEWASGLHLVEDKVTVNQKTNAQGIEKTETIEQSRPPVNSSADTTSRRDGSIGLQIAAVYQLRTFIEGKHGEDFIRPALLLILTLWEGLMDKHLKVYIELKNQEIHKHVSKEIWKQWRENKFKSSKSLFAKSLSEMLLIDNGRCLARQNGILVNRNLFGLEPYSDHFVKLDWNNVYLTNASILFTNFAKASLRDCDFSFSRIHKCIITETHFVDCVFTGSQLEECKFEYENSAKISFFTNCILNFNWMENSFFYSVYFSECMISVLGGSKNKFLNCTFQNIEMNIQNGIDDLSFEWCKFSNSNFEVKCRSTIFYDCVFESVNFTNTKIVNGLFNPNTKFQNCKVSSYSKIEVCSVKNERQYSVLFPVLPALPIETHALRLRLRDTNGLILNPQAYTDYADEWNQLSEVQQKDYYDNAYKNANQDDID